MRPFNPQDGLSNHLPFRWRGDKVTEKFDSWDLETGAIQTDSILLVADRIHYTPSTDEIVAEGHIRMEAPGLRLRCERLKMDWRKQVGEAQALLLEIPPTWSLSSRQVSFTSLRHWEFEKVEVSPCPEERPGWKAMVSNLKVDLEGYATMQNLWLWIKDVPTPYYMPWIMYPAKSQRTPGLLPPNIRYGGATGWALSIPYYQTFGDTVDATFSPEYYSKQGTMWGGELRWSPEPTHQGSFQGRAIHQTSDGENRYRYSLKELWQREDGWQFSADINQASDTLLESDYGSGIVTAQQANYDSSVFVGKNFSWASFNLVASEQKSFFTESDAFYSSEFPNSLKKQTLPEIQARLFPISAGRFYLDGGVRVGQMAYRLDLGDDLPEPSYRWNREDIFTRLQGRIGQFGPFRTDLQLQGRFTHYSATLHNSVFDTSISNGGFLDPAQSAAFNPMWVDGDSANRLLGSGRIQLSGPPLGRTFENLKLMGFSGDLKHVLEPFVAFTETTDYDQAGRVPRFDEVDSRPGVAGSAMGERSLEFGMKHHLLGRPGKGSDYLDLVRWRISTKYHFQPIILSDGRIESGWGSIDNDLDIEPNDRLRISFRRSAALSEGSGDNSLSAEYKTGDGSRLNLALFSTAISPFLVRQRGIQAGGMHRFMDDRLRLEFTANYDLALKKLSTGQVVLAYVTPCIATNLKFSRTSLNATSSVSRENRLELGFTLRNLGDLVTWSIF
ncbi:LPS-assembly protein LptD [Holophaga foetida]|uniref:LPS-assembly protein LptD n=1 Tax=Holophaga foetida TaxID=35839 RepID=UPI0002473ACE|nr:putative LPS assembly protein LptD [Holophaga foetida]